MSTYEMIQNKGIQIGREKERGIYEEIVARERQRAEEERQKAEEERQRLNNTILYFNRELNMSSLDISVIVNKDVEYIDELLALDDEEKKQ